MILAVDFGLRHCGVTGASLRGDVFDAWLSRSYAKDRQENGERIPAPTGPLAWRGMVSALFADLKARGYIERVEVLAIEWPEIYRVTPKDGDGFQKNPNDLLDLAAVIGGLVVALPRVARYEQHTPRQWKKSYPKGEYQKAILAALSPQERELVERTTPSLRHNVIESVGLARFVASVVSGAPMSVPAFQGRAKPAGPTKAAGPAPAYRNALPPGSSPGRPTYGSLHFPGGAIPRASKQDLKARAKPASYKPGERR